MANASPQRVVPTVALSTVPPATHSDKLEDTESSRAVGVPVVGAGSLCIIRQHHRYEIATRREAEAYRDVGFQVDVIMLADPKKAGSMSTEVVDGVTLHRIAGSRSKGGAVQYLVDYLSFMWRAGRLLTTMHRTKHYQIVQVSTLPDFLLLAAQPVRMRGAKVVSFIKEPSPELGRTIYENTKWDLPLKAFEQMAIRLADMIFTVTDELRETLIERGAKELRTHVVMNGGGDEYWVNDREVAPVPDPDQFTVICHGTIEHRYGHDTILEAVELLADEMPELRLTLCGEGSYSETVKDTIAAKGLEEIVTFHGFVSHEELIDHIYRADVGIVAQLASDYSHLVNTNKMFEYIMLRRPVIATRLRSVSTTFADSEIEFYEPGSGASLAQAIRNLRADPERRESLVASAALVHRNETSWSIQRERLLNEVVALARSSKWWRP